MDNKQFRELMKTLKNIEAKLNILINLLKASIPKPKVTPEERKVLKLCDKKHTIDEIVKETGKTKNNINVILTRLRHKGLIASVKLKNRVVYKRI